METTNRLYHRRRLMVVENGENYIIEAELKLDDECKNHVCEWSMTGEMYKCDKEGNRLKGKDKYCISGAIADEISKHIPELKDFVDMHLRNYLGQPMYPMENGIYWMKQGLEKGMVYLGATREEAEILSVDLEDKAYFKYQLFALGIVDRWKAKSDEMIKRLEKMTGKKWVNPYRLDEERFVLRITDEERMEIEEKIASGYYTKEAIRKRIDERRAEERKKIEDKYENELREEIDKINRKKTVYLYLFDKGITNAIYHVSTNKVEFNWTYGRRLTKEEFDEFVRTCDMSKLPEGITFKLGK